MKVFLKLSKGGKPKREFVLRKAGEYTVGRAENANVVIEDNRVSKVHCVIILRSMEARLRDTHSTNGTQVDDLLVGGRAEDHDLPDGASIRREVALSDGSVIEIGAYRIDVSIVLDERDREKIDRWLIEGLNKITEAHAIYGKVLEVEPGNSLAEELYHNTEMLQQLARGDLEGTD